MEDLKSWWIRFIHVWSQINILDLLLIIVFLWSLIDGYGHVNLDLFLLKNQIKDVRSVAYYSLTYSWCLYKQVAWILTCNSLVGHKIRRATLHQVKVLWIKDPIVFPRLEEENNHESFCLQDKARLQNGMRHLSSMSLKEQQS